MPLSNRVFDTVIEQFLKNHLYKDYFDIGCGAGKYAKMIRAINPDALVVGIEVDEEYIEKYDTAKYYDLLITGSIEQFIRENASFTTELAILGDVLEHLFKSDGIDLIHYLIYRCKEMIIIWPSKFVMYDYKGHPHEAHNSVWTKEDFQGFDYTYERQGHMNLIILKGYLSDPETIYNLDK